MIAMDTEKGGRWASVSVKFRFCSSIARLGWTLATTSDHTLLYPAVLSGTKTTLDPCLPPTEYPDVRPNRADDGR